MGGTGVSSQYRSIRATDQSGIGYVAAVSGARMSDAPGQAMRAVDQGDKYVTILSGPRGGAERR